MPTSDRIIGATVILPQQQLLEHFWHDIIILQATWFSATPWLHRQFMQAASSHLHRPVQSLRFVQSTGSSLDDHQLLEMEKLYHCQIITSYSMTVGVHES
jgi:acyl-coenzyme A synthetase/AMP-(fatty) acid ligase